MPLTRRLSFLCVTILLTAACAPRVHPPFTRLEPNPRLAVPAVASNLVVNGGFEEIASGEPPGWKSHGKGREGAQVRVVETPDAPEGKRVAEISLSRAGRPDYGLYFLQDVPVEPWTPYDLSVWVRGIDLVSEVGRPYGFGQHCGLFFWLLGPEQDFATRIFPSGAFPRKDGTTSWELRKMRFTTPPREAFPPPAPGADSRFHLSIQVLLYGTGTIQVDDIRLAPSAATPPPPRRGPGRLAVAQRSGKPFFAIGIHNPPEGLTWRDVAKEGVFNLGTGAGGYDEKLSLGILSLTAPGMVDPACRTGAKPPGAAECPYCRARPKEEWQCEAYRPEYLRSRGSFGTCIDEENFRPEFQGDLEDLVRSGRRIKKEAAGLKPPGTGFYLFASDMPGGVYYNTYGWDDLAVYHASEAFDIVGTVRRGGNPPKGAVGGTMSEFRETSINGIRQSTRRVADDVTRKDGTQVKPVWMFVNGGSGKILTDRDDPAYPFSPHNDTELLASRPSLPQLRYTLYAAVLNGATGLLFYQDSYDTFLTAADPYYRDVMIPAAAEMTTLERETGFPSETVYNPLAYRLTGESEAVDSMLKRSGETWTLAVANSSPDRVVGVEFVLEGEERISGRVERLAYRHHRSAGKRRFEASPASGGEDRIPLDLPGYGVALYRFRFRG